jgi:hypothetical protein
MKGIDMKTVYSVIFLPCLIILLLVTSVNGSDWRELGTDNDGNVRLYDKASIKYRTKNIVQVWTETVFSDESRKNYIRNRRKRGLSTEKGDKLLHVLILQETDCKKKKSQILSIVHYDTDGNILFTQTYDKPEWGYVVPGSAYDNLRKKVCK